MSSRTIQSAAIMMWLAVLCYILGISTEKWTTLKFGDSESYAGLWERCIDEKCTALDWDCENESDNSTGGDPHCSDIEATRAFAFLAAITAFGAAVTQSLVATDRYTKAGKIAIGFSFLALLCGMIAFSVYASIPQVDETRYGFSFALEVLGFILSFCSLLAFGYGTRGTGYTMF